MTHVNAALTPTGRLRMVTRRLEDGVPKSHVAAECRIARSTVSTWVARYQAESEEGLVDRACTPVTSPSQTPPEVVERIEALRRGRKWSARRYSSALNPWPRQACRPRWVKRRPHSWHNRPSSFSSSMPYMPWSSCSPRFMAPACVGLSSRG